MLQNSDVRADAIPERRDWMALLARAPIDLLESTLGANAGESPQWLRAPETGLMMVQGRVSGTGERFNLGEVTVTRCALRVGEKSSEMAKVGIAYIIGRSHRRAQLAALADAMLQDDTQCDRLRTTLLTPARDYLARARAERYARAQSTKVEFFTVAREASGAGGEEMDDQ